MYEQVCEWMRKAVVLLELPMHNCATPAGVMIDLLRNTFGICIIMRNMPLDLI